MKYKNILICLLAAITLPALAQAKPDENGGKKGKEGFGKLDSNGDEVITLAEAEAAGAKKLVEHFSEIDADGSGEVTKEELRNHHKQRMEGAKAKRKKLDADDNGTISREEATSAGAKRLVENFDKIDSNGDGELDRDEMKALRKGKEKKKKDDSEG